VRKSAARKAVPTKKPAARKPAPRPAAPGAAARRQPARPSARPRAAAQPPVAHISPEEAVAHIQALLDAKHERDQREPSWPGANPSPATPNVADMHAPVSGAGGDASVTASPRDDLGKRKG